MSPIVAVPTYYAKCDLCGLNHYPERTHRSAAMAAEIGDWLIVDKLAVCPLHRTYNACPHRVDDGVEETWMGNCARCWREAMTLPRGSCGEGPSLPWDVTTLRGEPVHGHVCNHPVTRGWHPGPHQCACGAQW